MFVCRHAGSRGAPGVYHAHFAHLPRAGFRAGTILGLRIPVGALPQRFGQIHRVRLSDRDHTAEANSEEVVDSGHVYLDLAPGEQKRLDVFLARIEALNQKAKAAGQQVVWVTLFADSAEFVDGSRWDMHATPQKPSDIPVNTPRVR